MKRCENCAGVADTDHVCPSDDVRCIQLRAECAMLRSMLQRAFDEYIGAGDEPTSLVDADKALRAYDNPVAQSSGKAGT